MASSHRKRCRRYNEPGHAHALTFCCFRRQPFLSKDRSCRWLLDAIETVREKHRVHLWAWVIMPEHVHLLLWPTEPKYSIRALLASLKRPVTSKALVYVQHHAPAFLERMQDKQPNGMVSYRFWQRGGGYDRNLFEPKAIWAEIDYFHGNPVRRRFVRAANGMAVVECPRARGARKRPAANRLGKLTEAVYGYLRAVASSMLLKTKHGTRQCHPAGDVHCRSGEGDKILRHLSVLRV
jgi:putative transposase